ncbi:MAG TPA: hypothetical protein VMJ10_36390 [Kofleriaceae bacterium]|nr:hypothetical protein [Kofleriaceae bacterium]
MALVAIAEQDSCRSSQTISFARARALQLHGVMPRKQRFKPTRKPKPAADSHEEARPDNAQHEVEHDAPVRDPFAHDVDHGDEDSSR